MLTIVTTITNQHPQGEATLSHAGEQVMNSTDPFFFNEVKYVYSLKVPSYCLNPTCFSAWRGSYKLVITPTDQTFYK